MRFYSGFCLKNDALFFDAWLDRRQYTVAGFSYGAIKAVEYVDASTHRIDRLQLFSPAYFCNKNEAFRRLQLRGFDRDPQTYIQRFLQRCFSPYPVQAIEERTDKRSDLENLLTYSWPVSVLEALRERQIDIEIHFGEKDAVIDADAAYQYFLPYATIYWHNRANHFLQQGEV